MKLWWTILAALAGCAAQARDPLAVCSTERTIPARISVESSARAVALVLAELPEGKTRYGAGLVLDDHGSVITSWHIIKDARAVRVMLYRADRPSYTPMDGGLMRFMAENREAMIDAETIEIDRERDTVLIRIHADTSHVPKLELALEPPRVGDPVFALGHPNESVWSFTAGVISSVRGGVIQHDAALGTGSSGGPLLDAQGRVVGINTAKLFEPAEGIGYARPIAGALIVASVSPGRAG